MAKATQQTKSQTTKPTPSKEVATRGGSKQEVANDEDLAALDDMMAADAGKGVSTSIEDNIVPLVYILQALSPQVNKKKEEYVQGAEAGMIWFRGTKKVLKGEDGLLVVPCGLVKSWIEWQPNRGGFVGRHDYIENEPNKGRPADAKFVTDAQNPKKKFWQLPNGNTLTETREHAVIALDVFDSPKPFVIPMSGSGHGASRAWMTKQQKTVTVNGVDYRAPSYAFLYRMKLKFNSNDQGDWYMWDVIDENDVPTRVTDPTLYKMARQLTEDFEKGKKKGANIDDQTQVDGESGAGGGDTSTSRQRASEVL